MTDTQFETDAHLQALFEQWLTHHWPAAEAAADLLRRNSGACSAAAQRTLAATVHDLAGTAGLVGQAAMGKLALAVAAEGRCGGWAALAVPESRMDRLWRALTQAVACRSTTRNCCDMAAVLAPVSDLLG
jgi:hypothetical protein